MQGRSLPNDKSNTRIRIEVLKHYDTMAEMP
jgi:hypothetical protein